MPKCEVGECGVSCEFGCACMQYVGGCACWCENISLKAVARLPEFKKPRGMARADPEMYVDFTAADMSVIRLAEIFDFLFPGQIVVPASNIRRKITTEKVLRRIKLGDLIEHVGLVPMRKPLEGRDFARDESTG